MIGGLNKQDDDGSLIWCNKCVAFYNNCKSTAKSFNFELQGKVFGSLQFKCKRNGHLTKISYNRRLTQDEPINCIGCQK